MRKKVSKENLNKRF